MLRQFICLLFLLIPVASAASGYIYKQYTTDDGLLSNMIYCASQDSRGYLWIGTDCGVNRFDGRRFYQYTIEDGLSDSEIFNIKEDSKGRIWFLTYNGRLSYYYKNIIYNEQNDPALRNTFYGASFYNMYEDSKGNLWFLSMPAGCLKMDSTGKFEKFSFSSSIWMIYEDAAGNMNFIGDSLTTLIDGRMVKRSFPVKPFKWSGCIAGKNDIIYITEDRLIRMKDDKQHVLIEKNKNILDKYVTRITKTRTDRIWVNTNVNGSYLLVPGEGMPSLQNFLPGKIIMNNLEDHEGNTWFCTSGEGIFLLKSTYEDVKNFTKESGLADERVCSFIKTGENTYLLGCSNSSISLIQSESVFNYKLQLPGNTGRLVRINDLQKSNDSSIYYCSSDIGVQKIIVEGTNLRVIPYSVYAQTIDSCIYNYAAKSCYPDKNGDCYVTVSFGIYKAERNDYCLRKIYQNEKEYRHYTHFFDSENNLWTSEMEGLKKNRQLIDVIVDGKKETGRITAIRQCGKAMIIAVEGKGIVAFENPAAAAILKVNEGMASGTTRKLFIDGVYIYAATNQGISKLIYDGTELKHIRNYTLTDGLVSNDIQDVYVENDYIYAATGSGLCILQEKGTEKRSDPPSVYFYLVRNAGETMYNYDSLEFDYNDVHLILNYNAPTFIHPDKVMYKYVVLKDNEKPGEWTETINHRIEFSSLNPGEYTFLLAARKINSDWSKPIHLNFSVKPLFWQTTWFISLAAIGIIGIVSFLCFLIYKRNIRKKLDQLEKKEAINHERARIATDIHDDLGSELTTIAINAEVLKHYLRGDDKIVSHFNSLIESSRGVVEKLSEIIWAVNASNDNLKNLVAYLHEFAGKYFDESTITIHSEMPATVPDYSLTAAFRRNIFLIVKEAFHNIVRHSKASSVDFRIIFEKNSSLDITISDDGIGIISSNGINKNGLNNMKKRAADINAKLKVNGNAAGGTVVSLSVPLAKFSNEIFHTKV